MHYFVSHSGVSQGQSQTPISGLKTSPGWQTFGWGTAHEQWQKSGEHFSGPENKPSDCWSVHPLIGWRVLASVGCWVWSCGCCRRPLSCHKCCFLWCCPFGCCRWAVGGDLLDCSFLSHELLNLLFVSRLKSLELLLKKISVLFLWPHLLMLLLLLLIWYCFNHWLCQNEPECLLVVKRRQG